MTSAESVIAFAKAVGFTAGLSKSFEELNI